MSEQKIRLMYNVINVCFKTNLAKNIFMLWSSDFPLQKCFLMITVWDKKLRALNIYEKQRDKIEVSQRKRLYPTMGYENKTAHGIILKRHVNNNVYS